MHVPPSIPSWRKTGGLEQPCGTPSRKQRTPRPLPPHRGAQKTVPGARGNSRAEEVRLQVSGAGQLNSSTSVVLISPTPVIELVGWRPFVGIERASHNVTKLLVRPKGKGRERDIGASPRRANQSLRRRRPRARPRARRALPGGRLGRVRQPLRARTTSVFFASACAG